MNRAEIKQMFRDDNPEITERVVTDTTLDNWCEVGDKDFCAKTKCIVDENGTDFTALVGTTGTPAIYNLVNNISKFFDIDEFPGGGVSFDGKRLKLKSLAEFDADNSEWRANAVGIPASYAKRGTNIIFNRPCSVANTIKVYAILISDDFNDDTIAPYNQLTYLEPYHYAMVLYLQGKAKMKVGKPEEKKDAMLEYNEYVRWATKELQGGKIGKIRFIKPNSYSPRGSSGVNR